MTNTISFPGLFDKVLQIDRIAFEVGPLSIKWYGVIIACGVLLACVYVMMRARQFGTSADQMTDLLIWALPIAVICARIYYVVNSWGYYSEDLSRVFQIWNGGLAIYGGVIGGFATAFVFCRIKKANAPGILDLGSLGLLIGQAVGRWGNFINAEAFGSATSLPWGMSINGGAPVHPAFIYESLWTIAGFIALHFYSKRRRFGGEIALLYLGWYGLGRAWIEGLRADSLYLGTTDIRISQLLAVLCVVFSAGMLIYCYATKKYTAIDPATGSPEVGAVRAQTPEEAVSTDEPKMPAEAEPAQGAYVINEAEGSSNDIN